MTGVAITRPVGPLTDIMRGRIPVIGQRVKVFHLNTGGCKGIAHCGNQAQRRQHFFVSWVFAQNHPGTGRGVASVTIIAIAVGSAGMATVTRHLALMLAMSNFRRHLGFVSQFMAVSAGGPVFYLLFGCICLAVSVKFSFFMAVHAQHAFLVMNVRRTAVFADVFRINTAAVTKCAGFAFIFLHKLMFCDQPNADPADRRPFDMAIPAGCMTAPAGFFKHLLVKCFQLLFGEAGHNAVSLTGCCIMQGLGVIVRNLFMTSHAGAQIVRRFFYHAFMRFFSFYFFGVSFVAKNAAHFEMRIFLEEFLIDNISEIHFFRPDRRRSARSPLACAYRQGRRFVH